nr:hypothetical protein CFOL_v3_12690 [Ipomoea trifida]
MPFPSLCCNRVLTILSISSLLTTFTVGPTAGLTATPTSFASMVAFIFCSAYSGHATIGTLFVRLSRVEFHPQWDRNPPTDGWVNISIWLAHIWTTNPTSRVRARNSSGKALTVLGSSSSQVLTNSPSNRVYSIPRLTYSRQSSSPRRGRMISVPRNPQFLGNGQGLGTKYVDNQGVGAAVHGGDAGPDARKCLPDRYP